MCVHNEDGASALYGVTPHAIRRRGHTSVKDEFETGTHLSQLILETVEFGIGDGLVTEFDTIRTTESDVVRRTIERRRDNNILNHGDTVGNETGNTVVEVHCEKIL